MQRTINTWQLAVEYIEPHPQNPRKDVGDVTELAASIKESGILQPLTVVPDFNGFYLCIIGHRRLAAAKTLQLETVPCIVAEMTPEKQIATMIAENMQRADLTIPEQVGAVQLMLDLGEDLESVAKMTGLAVKTVKQRAKIAGLTDNATLTKAWAHGVTLLQIEQIAKIEDPARRAALWEKSTEKYFDRAISAALYEEENEKFEKRVRTLLEEAGVEELQPDEQPNARWKTNIAKYNEPKTVDQVKIFVPKVGAQKYYRYTFSYGAFSIYAVYEPGKQPDEKERYDALTLWKMRVTAQETAFFDREKDFIATAAKREESAFAKPREHYLGMVLNEIEKEDRIFLRSDMRETFSETETQIGKLFLLACGSTRPGSTVEYTGERNEMRAEAAVRLIKMIEAEGYEPTELEIMFFDGTHPIWSDRPEKEEKA